MSVDVSDANVNVNVSSCCFHTLRLHNQMSPWLLDISTEPYRGKSDKVCICADTKVTTQTQKSVDLLPVNNIHHNLVISFSNCFFPLLSNN